MPGVIVELRAAGGTASHTETDTRGAYRFDRLAAGPAQLSFALINFASATREVGVPAAGRVRSDVVLYLALSADVTVTAKSTFTNLADAEDPALNLVGIAQSASQGAITARQLDTRPVMRAGEVLETVPGVVISQHSGEGKANQYYLRGFNLDHGTDFATTVAGMPVNMPTHGHGHGYSDLNFLIPELVSGVQFSKGPYFADQGDFATAGAANINYTNCLARPIVRVVGGGQGYGRALVAASPSVGAGPAAGGTRGPAQRRPVGATRQLSQGQRARPLQPRRRVERLRCHGHGISRNVELDGSDSGASRHTGSLDRFGTIDTTDGGDSYRYSGSFEWQRTRGNASTKVTAFGIGYDLNLFSNFTYFLDDPVNGDQFQQADQRFVTGAKLSHRRLGRWGGRPVQNTIGHSDCGTTTSATWGCITRSRVGRSKPFGEDSVLQTSVAGYVQNETEWTPWLRTLAGVRVDGYRFDVKAGDPANSGTEYAGLVSPKGGAVLGPWQGTELYVNAGLGFHSNDARGATITVDPQTGDPADRVTPLARAKGAEVGIRSVADSSPADEPVALDAEPRFGADLRRRRWHDRSRPPEPPVRGRMGELLLTAAVADASTPTSPCRAHTSRTMILPGTTCPGPWPPSCRAAPPWTACETCSAACAGDTSARGRCVEDNSIRSRATSLVNLEVGYRFSNSLRLALDVFNLFDAEAQRHRLLLHVAAARRAERGASTTSTFTRRCPARRESV